MYIMDAKLILNGSESLSQDKIQASRLNDGLRILARIIARDLLDRRSAYANKKAVKVNDTHVSADS
jgi:hypothetical protein